MKNYVEKERVVFFISHFCHHSESKSENPYPTCARNFLNVNAAASGG